MEHRHMAVTIVHVLQYAHQPPFEFTAMQQWRVLVTAHGLDQCSLRAWVQLASRSIDSSPAGLWRLG
jgi:hypothetical protein